MFFGRAAIASIALHLAVIGGVAYIGTGHDASRADNALFIELKGTAVQGTTARTPADIGRPESLLPKKETPVSEAIIPTNVIEQDVAHIVPVSSAVEAVGDNSNKASSTGDGGTEIAYASGESSGTCPNPDIISEIRSAIEREKSYPLIARKRQMEGTVVASFRIDESGTPTDITLVKSSGHGILDKEALQTIKRASPYPTVKGSIEVPISFKLE